MVLFLNGCLSKKINNLGKKIDFIPIFFKKTRSLINYILFLKKISWWLTKKNEKIAKKFKLLYKNW